VTRFTGALATGLAAVALLAGCGSSNPAAGQVRASYGLLLHALASHDAVTVCELLLPVGQDQPRSALVDAAHRLSKPSAAAAYRRYVASSCVPEFRAKPENINGYYGLIRGSRLGAVSIRGPVAEAAITSRTGRRATALFVDAGGRWRLVIGVD
jgi:hypothetical protein